MSRSLTSIAVALFIPVLLTSCNGGKPPYHRQEALSEPTPFSSEITTTNGIAFSPEGKVLYTSSNLADTFANGRKAAGIFQHRFSNGKWNSPELMPIKGLMDAYHPVLSADGQRLFFNSRSHPDSADTYLKHDICYMEKTGEGWSAPRAIEAIRTSDYESYPSVAANGNLYFNSDRPGGKGGMDFYMSAFIDGLYTTLVRLGAINSANEENDLVVDPQERFIIFNRYEHASKSIDLWISFREEGGWATPKKLAVVNKNDQWELTPSLSPDGKYFFYELNGRIMQVDLSAVIRVQR